jgi:diguanylate cyclase (GGDEF)-like protein
MQVTADLLVAIACYILVVGLVTHHWQSRWLPARGFTTILGVFFGLCGVDRLLDIWQLWHSEYWLIGLVKIATAAIGIYVVAEIFRWLLPPYESGNRVENPREAILQQAICERQNAQSQLYEYKEKLEELVLQRTSKLLEANQQLSWQATHDELTGLMNRRRFIDCLQKLLEERDNQSQESTLCYLDLDQFKSVNDTCGHAAGDELLCQVSELLRSNCRQSDALARLGGDEFALLLDRCSPEEAQRVTNTLLQAVQQFRFVWQDKVFAIGISIGMIHLDHRFLSVEKILQAADVACYAAKNQGRNCIHLYRGNEMPDNDLQGNREWENSLNQAILAPSYCDRWVAWPNSPPSSPWNPEYKHFRLYYQPIVPLTKNGNCPQYYELLLRFVDETGKVISPMAFIPAAERNNLMPAIDRWAIENLFSILQQYGTNQTNSNVYAINISGATLNDQQFVRFLEEKFAQYQISPHIICFEITETVAISNFSQTFYLIQQLRNQGVRFALDDFGSGMFLGHWQKLPVSCLKIDGKFTQDMDTNPIHEAMVESIHRIGKLMGIQTIAECVENQAILEKIRKLQIDYAQGYAIARPVPLLDSGHIKQPFRQDNIVEFPHCS